MAAQACGGTTSTDDDGGIDSAANDVTTIDVATVVDSGTDVVNIDDTGTDAIFLDANDGGTTIDTGIGTWGCGSATVTDCAQCIGHSMPCVYCANADASAISGVCVQEGTGCGNSMPTGYNLCACPKDAGANACPEAFQVCLPAGGPFSVCDTCGAVNTTNGLTCKSGGKCDATDGGCL